MMIEKVTEDLIKRKEDLENLSKIPIIEYKVDGLIISVKTISDNLGQFNGVKNDVGWLKKIIFWWGGIISGIILLIVGTLLKKG